jgi:hypothetical protein
MLKIEKKEEKMKGEGKEDQIDTMEQLQMSKNYK